MLSAAVFAARRRHCADTPLAPRFFVFMISRLRRFLQIDAAASFHAAARCRYLAERQIFTLRHIEIFSLIIFRPIISSLPPRLSGWIAGQPLRLATPLRHYAIDITPHYAASHTPLFTPFSCIFDAITQIS
jgi:hypothetical protein